MKSWMCWVCWEVISVTLCKLSLRNARRQARDYLVYFVTVILSAALIHAFNGLVFSQELRALSSFMSSLPLITVLVSAVVIAIMGWLIRYIMNFMLSRRSRELGTYILIGLENGQVAQLFFLENLATGAAALSVGLLLGGLFFQILRAVTLSLFHMPYTFRLSASPKAVALTIAYFAVIYLLALRSCGKRLRRMQICELLSYDRRGEEEAIQSSRGRRRVFTVSIASGILGTLLLLSGSLLMGIMGAALVMFFLYGFFLSFSSGVPAYFNARPGKKYGTHTLLVFRTLSFKLGTMGMTMATISLLFTGTIVSEGTGMLFGVLFQSRVEGTTCCDIFIGTTDGAPADFGPYLDYIEENIPLRGSRQYRLYQGETRQMTDYLLERTDYYAYYAYDPLMAYSDYAALRAMLGYPEAPAEPGRYIIHCMAYLEDALEDYDTSVSVGGATLSPGAIYTESFSQKLWDGNGRGFLLVVPDEFLSSRPVSHSVYAAMTLEPLSEADYDRLRDIHDGAGEDSGQGHARDSYFLLAKDAVAREYASVSATTIFPLFYLALVLTLVSATILTVQQLSQGPRLARQFGLLEKLGMDRREMARTLRRQLAVYYAMPAVPPLLIGIPLLVAMGHSFEPGAISGDWQLAGILGVTLGLFFLIYLVYILTAYSSLKRSVLPG